MRTLRHLLNKIRLQPRWEIAFTLAVVILAVAIPTIGLLYYMNRSSNAERNQLLGDLASSRQESLDSTVVQIRQALIKRTQVPAASATLPPEESFRSLTAQFQCVGCLVLGEDGSVIFPILTTPDPGNLPTDIEQRAYDFLNGHGDEFLRLGKFPDVELHLKLVDQLSKKRFQQIKEGGGRMLWPTAMLAALGEMPPSHPRRPELVNLITKLVEDRKIKLPSAQRLFLAHELRKQGGSPNLPMEAAEAISLRLASSYAVPVQVGQFSTVSRNPALLMVRPAHSSVVLFFNKEQLVNELTSLANASLSSTGLTAKIHAHGELGQDAAPLAARSLGNLFPGWELSGFGSDGSAEIAQRLNRLKLIHRISALVGCIVIAGLAAWAIRRFAAGARLTQAKHDFLSIVSHELKTPLTSIRMFVDSLANGGLEDSERAKTYLDFIRGENERLSRLVENFLTFSRIEGGRMNFDFHVVHPEDITEAVNLAVTERCNQTACRFVYSAEPALPLVRADMGAMTTVMVNLIDNAIKYTREDKQVFFTVSKVASQVHFTVRDNGIGMNDATIRRLGEKFYRDRAAIQSGRGGFGLGLHIVRSIVEAHGGTLQIESTAGVGTCFTVALGVSTDVTL